MGLKGYGNSFLAVRPLTDFTWILMLTGDASAMPSCSWAKVLTMHYLALINKGMFVGNVLISGTGFEHVGLLQDL